MADESKTEQPTEKRLRESHARGQFARSPELQAAAVMGAVGFGLFVLLPLQTERIFGLAAGILGHLGRYEIKAEAIGDWALVAAGTVFVLALPVLAIAALAGTLVGALQSGFRLTGDVLKLDLNRLNPASGFQRIFSPAGGVRFGLDLLKLGLVGWILYGAVRGIMSDPIFYAPVEVARLGSFLLGAGTALLGRAGVAIGGVAVANYLYQLHKTRRDLMMTRQEVKEEHLAAEGNPLYRALRRQRARQLLQKQMLKAVPTADVVITNPTHYAVALRYQRGADRAPIVLARGQNLFARRIKAIAAEHGVPTVENPPVARALYKYGQVDKPIPAELYRAVAEILAFVYRTHRYYFHQLKSRRLTAK